MAVNAQAVIQAIVRALEEEPHKARLERKPVITVSRTTACRGDEIARAVAERLGVECYDREILDSIAASANVSKRLIQEITEKLDATDAWVYSAVFGKHVSRDDYVKYLTTIIRGLYHTGGVIVGRGGHVILAGRRILRVRLVGSVEPCAARLAELEGINYSEAKRKVLDINRRRDRFIWELFHSRYSEPTNFDLILNTDNFRRIDDVVEIILTAAKAQGFARNVAVAAS